SGDKRNIRLANAVRGQLKTDVSAGDNAHIMRDDISVEMRADATGNKGVERTGWSHFDNDAVVQFKPFVVVFWQRHHVEEIVGGVQPLVKRHRTISCALTEV